jgi:serine/threonine-protein kinase RsbW
MGRIVELEIPARPEYLSLARLVVAAAASIEPTFRDDRIEDLRIAVSEATTNAIAAHTELEGEERIVVRCDLDDERIEVWIEDQGLGFDPDALTELPAMGDPERLAIEGGFGLPLMRVLTDEAEVRSSPEGTAVKLVVHQKRRT